jgi:hypothetical protein
MDRELERRRHLESSKDEEERQEQLRAAAMKFAGAIEGDDPLRAENASAEVRARLAPGLVRGGR